MILYYVLSCVGMLHVVLYHRPPPPNSDANRPTRSPRVVAADRFGQIPPNHVEAREGEQDARNATAIYWHRINIGLEQAMR